MGPFKVDSKFTSSFERKGFRSLAVVKNEWKDVPVEAFPPIREIFIPNQCLSIFFPSIFTFLFSRPVKALTLTLPHLYCSFQSVQFLDSKV